MLERKGRGNKIRTAPLLYCTLLHSAVVTFNQIDLNQVLRLEIIRSAYQIELCRVEIRNVSCMHLRTKAFSLNKGIKALM